MKIILLLLPLLLPLSLFANDTVLQGIGGSDIMPIHDKRLEMVSEDITMTMIDTHFVQVEAIYKFKNLRSETVKVDLGFPELSCEKEGEIDTNDGRMYKEAALKLCGQKKSPKFRNFETWVNQKKVSYKIVSTKATKVRSIEIPEYDVVYAYVVDFEPNQEVEVKHSYQLLASEAMGEAYDIYYLTKTGNFWAKPIGRATFTFRHHIPLMSITFPDDYVLRSFSTEYINQKYQIEFRFEMLNWLPKQDLMISYILLAPQSLAMMYNDSTINCPQIPRMKLTNFDQQEVMDILNNPNLDRNRDRVQKCLNLINAYYGYPFKHPKIRPMFYQDQPIDIFKRLKKNCHNGYQNNYCTNHLEIPLAEIPYFTEKAISLENQYYLRYLKIISDALKK
jgi:hypothetical protein